MEFFFENCLHAASVDFRHLSIFFEHFSIATDWTFRFWVLWEEIEISEQIQFHSSNSSFFHLTRNWAFSSRRSKCRQDHRCRIPSSLRHHHMMWDNRQESYWRFQFSPETCKMKLEPRKRVFHSLMIAFCTEMHTIAHLIHTSVLLHANSSLGSFLCSDNVCDLFGPVTIRDEKVHKFQWFFVTYFELSLTILTTPWPHVSSFIWHVEL